MLKDLAELTNHDLVIIFSVQSWTETLAFFSFMVQFLAGRKRIEKPVIGKCIFSSWPYEGYCFSNYLMSTSTKAPNKESQQGTQSSIQHFKTSL